MTKRDDAALFAIRGELHEMWRRANEAGVPFEDFVSAIVLTTAEMRAKRRACGARTEPFSNVCVEAMRHV
jgi:hypothetical protein